MSPTLFQLIFIFLRIFDGVTLVEKKTINIQKWLYLYIVRYLIA